MDAKRFGIFLAERRREQQMTQAELAAKLNVTDKAVSRWERGVGFPDIGTLEPLAAALGLSVAELMRSERIDTQSVTEREASEMIVETIDLVKVQHSRERREALTVLVEAAVLVLLVLFADSRGWRPEALVFEGVGVLLPLLCVCGFGALLAYGGWRRAAGKPWGQTLKLATALLMVPVFLAGALLLAGALGLGPIPG